MIRIAGIDYNNVVNGEGISVSLYLQGCPFHCPGCHNPDTWDPEGGNALQEEELIQNIIEGISKNNIQRNLSILGGEPIDTQDKINFLNNLIKAVRKRYPHIKIFMWTGFIYERLKHNNNLKYIFENIDYLIDGSFRLEERDITLKWRGSRNQRIIDMRATIQTNEVKLYKA